MEKESPHSFKEYYFPTVSDEKWNDYVWQISNRITTLERLCHFLKIGSVEYHKLKKNENNLKFSITPYYLSLIDPNDDNDPIRLQCVPSSKEFEDEEGLVDPLLEKGCERVENVIQKYPDRVVLTVTNFCPVYCRHCFRRDNWLNKDQKPLSLIKIVGYLKENKGIKEVIISGGEPPTLPLNYLDNLLNEIRKIESVEVIRLASRLPVVLPFRIDDGFIKVLKKYSPIWFMTHFNHPREVTKESTMAIKKLIENGILVLNQSVLLKGINDDVNILENLFRKLIKIGVKPYYLYQCDPAKGVSHFRTSIFKGMEIIEKLRGNLSGIAVPNFAIDLEGGGKVTIEPNNIISIKENMLIVKNFEGKLYEYRLKEESVKRNSILPFKVENK